MSKLLIILEPISNKQDGVKRYSNDLINSRKKLFCFNHLDSFPLDDLHKASLHIVHKYVYFYTF